MKKWYFTFGLAQYKLAHKYVCIEARSYQEARSLMMRMFGTSWCTDYSEEDWIVKKNSVNWNALVLANKIPKDALYDAISIAQVYKLTELNLN